VVGLEQLALACSFGAHLNIPAGAMPVLFDELRGFLALQRPSDVTSVACLVILSSEKDLAFAKQLVHDLAIQRLLIALDRREEVGPVLL